MHMYLILRFFMCVVAPGNKFLPVQIFSLIDKSFSSFEHPSLLLVPTFELRNE